jgi:hypothetical protein
MKEVKKITLNTSVSAESIHIAYMLGNWTMLVAHKLHTAKQWSITHTDVSIPKFIQNIVQTDTLFASVLRDAPPTKYQALEVQKELMDVIHAPFAHLRLQHLQKQMDKQTRLLALHDDKISVEKPELTKMFL